MTAKDRPRLFVTAGLFVLFGYVPLRSALCPLKVSGSLLRRFAFVAYPPLKRPVTHSRQPCEVGQGHDRAFVFYQRGVGAVPRLLFGSGPPAIARLIVSERVNPVDRMGWRRLRPHVSQKRGEVVPPLLADGYAVPAVPSSVTRVGGRKASDFDKLPRSVFWSKLAARCCTVRDVHFTESLRTKAPAAFRVSGCKGRGRHNNLSAAIASAPPSGASLQGGRSSKNEQPRITHSSAIYLPHLVSKPQTHCYGNG